MDEYYYEIYLNKEKNNYLSIYLDLVEFRKAILNLSEKPDKEIQEMFDKFDRIIIMRKEIL